MKQEDKELLLQDLCARLPYGVKIDVTYSKDSGSSLRARLCSEGINTLDTNILGLFQQSEIYIKPYLFPLSSMTVAQQNEFTKTLLVSGGGLLKVVNVTIETYDWLNKNHFDSRSLIEKGLAIDCTNLNIY